MSTAANVSASSAPPHAFTQVRGLHHFGLTQRGQVALLLPMDYEDLSNITTDPGTAAAGTKITTWLTSVSPLRTQFSNGTPRSSGGFKDVHGNLYRGTFFGDCAAWEEAFANGAQVAVICQVEMYREEVQLTLQQIISSEWAGRIRPKYKPKPGVLKSEEVRDLVLDYLPHAVQASAIALEKKLSPLGTAEKILKAIGAGGWSLTQLLEEAHLPASLKMGQWARARIRDLAALGSFLKLKDHEQTVLAKSFPLKTLGKRAAALPFVMTEEQKVAVREIAAGLNEPTALRWLLIGDVGTGKTACFGLVAACVADAGGRCAILAPNLPLAAQIRHELQTAWPDIRFQLVTGESGEQIRDDTQIAIGTTALLHRTGKPFDFVVVDEEQKFSVEQKKALVSLSCHHLTTSATPLPRSLALARYGAIGMSELREQHVVKFIESKLHAPEQRKALNDDILLYLRDKNAQLLVVYPMRDQEGQEGSQRVAATQAAELWEKVAPGMVRCLSGDDTDENKIAIVQDMKEKRAQILVATTVVEVGITIPALRRCLVIDPQRHGLMTLHQLRGRVSRAGGEGWFDMMPREPLKDEQQSKLERFLECKNGFEVAELDLAIRGPGDFGMDAVVQSGADRSFLFGEPLDPKTLARMEPVWRSLTQDGQ